MQPTHFHEMYCYPVHDRVTYERNGDTAPFILNLGTRWSGHRHVPTALPREKMPRHPPNEILGGPQCWWVPVLVWRFWKREESPAPAGTGKHFNKVIITKYAGEF